MHGNSCMAIGLAAQPVQVAIMLCFIFVYGVLKSAHLLVMLQANLPKSLKWKDLAKYESEDGMP